MTLSDLAIDGLLNPCDFVDQGIAVVVHHIDGEAVLRIDDPDEQKPCFLQLVESEQLLDALVSHVIVGDGDTARRIGSGELPWRVAGNDVEETPISVFELGIRQSVEEIEAIRVADLLTQWNGPELLDVALTLDVDKSFIMVIGRFHVPKAKPLYLSIRVLFVEELLLESGNVLVDLLEQGGDLVLLLWQVVNEDVLLLAEILSASEVRQLIDLVVIVTFRLKHWQSLLVRCNLSLDKVFGLLVQSGLLELLLREDVSFVRDLLLAFRLAFDLLTSVEVGILLVFAVLPITSIVRVFS